MRAAETDDAAARDSASTGKAPECRVCAELDAIDIVNAAAAAQAGGGITPSRKDASRCRRGILSASRCAIMFVKLHT